MADAPWIYSIAFLTIIFILLYLYCTRKFDYWKDRNVFYVKPIPFFGNMLPMLRMTQSSGEYLGDLCRKVSRDYFGIFIFDRPVLVVNSPKLVKAILQKDFIYFQDRSVAFPETHPVVSNVMFFTHNPKWKVIRTKVSPVFTSGKLKLMFPLVLNESKAMIDFIGKLTNVPNVEAKEICAKYSTNVIARCAFAVEAKSFENLDAEFRNLGRRTFDFSYLTALRQSSGWFAPKLMKLLRISFFDDYSLKRFTEIFKNVLHIRMASTSLKGNDLIDILLEDIKKGNESNIDENELLGQAIQFFFAGFETVSATLSFTLYELCVHPDIQERLRKEILDNIKEHNGITYEGISEMKYLDMCLSEALRKFPVLPFLDRTCKADYKVEDSDLIIEKGISVYIPLFGLHYDPNYFPDPQKFDPERFADKTKMNQDGMFYVPFGEGPRICIGNRFGLMTVKLGIVAILTKYKLVATDKTPTPLKFTGKSILLQSPVGIPLKFVPI